MDTEFFAQQQGDRIYSSVTQESLEDSSRKLFTLNANENGWNGRETFASSVKVGSKKPILNLEEIEHHLQDVQCGDDRMKLHFVDASSARDARAACHGGHGGLGGLIITSHESCNRDGERAVYRIDDVSYAEEGVALDLAVTEALWQDAFDNLDINFGHSRYDHIYRRHSDFLRARRKRQDDLTIEIPTNTPENVTDVTFDLTSELIDTTFSATDFLTGIENFVPVPGVAVPDLPIEIGCKNCSTRGQIILTQGAIKIDTKQIDLVPDIFEGGDDGKEINSVITGGYMDLAVTGVGARLEMFARPINSGSYEIALFPLPVLGFVIPGIGQAGASFEPKISVDFEIDGKLAVNYGIDVAILDGAGIKVELGDLTNTTITGIKGATLKALPFTSNVTDVDLSLSLAFTPTIPIGFDFSDKLSALVTVSMDLPRLDARLTTKAKNQCSRLNKGKKPKTDSKAKPKDADLSSLVLVEANVSVAIDVSADLTLPLLPAPFDSAGTSAQIFTTEMPLMTSCVAPVKGKLKITEMAPAATIAADRAEVKAVKPCTCATATTTVYAAPPTGTPPPLEMTPYYPSAPPVETPTTNGTQPPALEMTPYYPVSTPTGGNGYGPVDQPPSTSTPCPSTQTLRITISTPPATTTPPTTDVPAPPPIIIISASKLCNSTFSTTTGGSPPPSSASTFTSTPTSIPTSNSTTPASSTTPSTPLQSTSLQSTPLQSTPPTTTTPPKVEESKGFMAPPGSSTSAASTPTPSKPSEFTGAAIRGVRGPRWVSAVLAGVVAMGMMGV
ncbi:hypothetical protein EKO04_005347 [Ascochyta lentis]|uniref:Uncharacterized protein n=1 Tax=Ascochyta lentis TaxID=205686 RepID=A0A8H7MHL1_9PLEO|nr:hypothetical protein EKO04_005347 [Ascochyta lentis]